MFFWFFFLFLNNLAVRRRINSICFCVFVWNEVLSALAQCRRKFLNFLVKFCGMQQGESFAYHATFHYDGSFFGRTIKQHSEDIHAPQNLKCTCLKYKNYHLKCAWSEFSHPLSSMYRMFVWNVSPHFFVVGKINYTSSNAHCPPECSTRGWDFSCQSYRALDRLTQNL